MLALPLFLTTDKVQVITSSGADLDVVCSYVDMSQDNPPVPQGDTTAPQATVVTTAGTADIVAAPAGSTTRIVKAINIRNIDTTTTNDVTVQLNRNASLYTLFKTTLQPGEVLTYTEGIGWFVYTPTTRLSRYLRVPNDITFAVAGAWGDVTGLTCPVEAGKHYGFLAKVFHIENASSTGFRLGVNGPAATAMRVGGYGVFIGSLTAAPMQAALADVAAYDTSVVGVTTTSAGTPQVVTAEISGWINTSAAGTVAVRAQSEVSVAAGVTVKAGSWCHIWEFDN